MKKIILLTNESVLKQRWNSNLGFKGEHIAKAHDAMIKKYKLVLTNLKNVFDMRCVTSSHKMCT
jgi:hypothetical protein